ncbi:MAG: single-stranded DNA-binding protein [Kutzneria sp.]|nr:single-stranded DNA-binding protein [Kutzneria sp.]
MQETTVTIVGNISKEISERHVMDGTKVVNFGVVTNERKYDRDSGQWVDGDKLYAYVTCWRKLAQGVAGSLKKGDPVIVTGRLYQENYEVKGETRTAVRIEANAVGPNLGRCTVDVRRGAGPDAGHESKPVSLEVINGGNSARDGDTALSTAVS